MKEVKVSEVINELKSDYEQIMAIENNKEYSRKQKDEFIRQRLIKLVEEINKYTEK